MWSFYNLCSTCTEGRENERNPQDAALGGEKALGAEKTVTHL
jgi:hypothetical protein